MDPFSVPAGWVPSKLSSVPAGWLAARRLSAADAGVAC
jgi:hypothetical protein